MNALGALIIAISGATVVFAILLALIGLPLRLERNLARSFIIEYTLPLVAWLRRRSDRPPLLGRSRPDRVFARAILSVWRPTKLWLLRSSGIRSQALALDLSKQAFYVNLSLAALALTTLVIMMIASDLSNYFVVHHSAADLPIFFRITATWAGSSGSLLFWYFLLTLFSAIAVYQATSRLYNRLPVLFLLLGFLQLLFVLLILFYEDAQPFRTYATEMAAGAGLNPLLQHWAMIIHPPILYVGYVSFAIPFAIAMSAVISRNLKYDWLPMMRRWSLFSWFFLGTGILLGSKWAYEELGWGGYWAWDPVENASLMPWLLGTAFIHSLIVQERRGMLRFWNVILVTCAYHMCLVGTWITRSGILEGPHTFAESDIGGPMIAFILISFVFSIRYVYFARNILKPERNIEAVTSKEGSMLLNNLLMATAMIIVLVGVFSPRIPLDCSYAPDEAAGLLPFVCHQVEWKQNAYNRIMVPLGLVTLFLMGASPLLAWRKNALAVWKKTIRLPLVIGIAGGTIFAFSYGMLFTGDGEGDQGVWGTALISEIMAILTVGIACFVTSGLAQEYYQGVRSRVLRFHENVVQATLRLVLRNKRRYGGYLVHLSIVFLFVGYSGSAFKKTDKFEFVYQRLPHELGQDRIVYYSGDKGYLEDYEIRANYLFLRPFFKENADPAQPIHFTISQEAHFHVQTDTNRPNAIDRRPDESIYAFANRPTSRAAQLLKFTTGYVMDGRMTSERHFHPQINPATGLVQRDETGKAMRTPTSEPDIRSTWNEDIYIQLGAIRDAATGGDPALNHSYEMYYYAFDQHPAAYDRMFPETVVATLEVWINPLVKFIWLGSLLFFFSGLLLLVPFGEPRQ